MTVRFHPAARSPATAAALACSVVLVGWLSYRVLGLPVPAGAMTLFFACQIGRYFFPTEYSFDERGIEIRHNGRRELLDWERFAAFERDRNGLFLSPFHRRHRLDALRGRFLPMDRPSVERVLRWLEERYVERA
ncbi:MAG: hypothetical protein HY319_08490 [Armatimonadetes bacterium]|nr:hypothetical protein [Armatimonadota bacterium]